MSEREELERFWSQPAGRVVEWLDSSHNGLTSSEASRRLAQYGPNRLRPARKTDAVTLLLAQFKSSLILILLAAAGLSFFLKEPVDALIIIGIILLSGVLGFWQEKRASDAVRTLLEIVRIETTVIRDGEQKRAPVETVVPGDICVFSAGDIIPADALILESKDLFVQEATLTGESFPAEKEAGIVEEDAPLIRRTNSLFMGTHVVSGTARALVILTGPATVFGKISSSLRVKPLETEFERGVRHFGYLLTEVTLILVVVIFGITVYLHRPVIDSFLFALAIAVGIIPELLPAIISINLAVGAVHMARRKVIVKQLESIENLGSMNVLCADKTGTLTEAAVKVRTALDAKGNASDKALFYAYLNSFYETGFANPIDEAIREHRKFDVTGYEKLDEIPYDFVRRRLSVLVGTREKNLMITKGAVAGVLDLCSSVDLPNGMSEIASVRPQIEEQFRSLGADGFRTLALAYKDMGKSSRIDIENESKMTFLGLLVLHDPPKAGVVDALNDLKKLGIRLKVITGDSTHVATSVTRSVLGFTPNVLTGNELKLMSSEAIRSRANAVDVFAEIEPAQKERIILALKKAGNTVGFLGDGINDAAALHSADVGISVNTAADVAKEAASLVLLEKDLGVLAAGVREGRKTFANTLKYIYMTTSANFGNMFSMAGAALLLPFLPLLPKQILLNNFLTDFPAMAISADSVDHELVETPRRWDIRFIRDFMIVFGIVSSFFDFLTFATLLFVLKTTQEEFRTGWFLESVMTEILIIVVMRTWKPFYRSKPGRPLLIAMIVVLFVTLALPYSPLRGLLGFAPLPISSVLLLAFITVLYAGASEVAKRFFYARYFTRARLQST